jgi:hypothetical protein
VGPRGGVDTVTKRKIPCPCRESNTSRQVRSLVTVLTELPRLRYVDKKVTCPICTGGGGGYSCFENWSEHVDSFRCSN